MFLKRGRKINERKEEIKKRDINWTRQNFLVHIEKGNKFAFVRYTDYKIDKTTISIYQLGNINGSKAVTCFK